MFVVALTHGQAVAEGQVLTMAQTRLGTNQIKHQAPGTEHIDPPPITDLNIIIEDLLNRVAALEGEIKSLNAELKKDGSSKGHK